MGDGRSGMYTEKHNTSHVVINLPTTHKSYKFNQIKSLNNGPIVVEDVASGASPECEVSTGGDDTVDKEARDESDEYDHGIVVNRSVLQFLK